MNKDKIVTRFDQMEPLGSDDFRNIFFKEPHIPTLYSDVLKESDIRDFDVLCKGMKEVAFEDPRAHKAFKFAAPLLYGFFYKLFGAYGKESNWIADQSRHEGKVSRAEMAILQRMYSMAHLGCSTTVVWDQDASEYVMMRSLDWRGAKSMGGATRIYHHYPHQGSTNLIYRSVGTLGMIGELSVLKPGLCAAINYAPWPAPSVHWGKDPTFLLRELFEDSKITTFHDAKKCIQNWRVCAPVFITLVGRVQGEACVLELSHNRKTYVRPVHDTPLIQTNHFCDAPDSPFKDLDRIQDENKKTQTHPMIEGVAHEPSDENWYASDLLPNSKQRENLIQTALNGFHGPSDRLEKLLIETYKQAPVFNHETIYWALLRPGSDQMKAFRRQRN